MSDQSYITRLTWASCSLGTMDNKLNLPTDHGVIFGDEETPLMNANDHEPNKHVIHFGRCTSCMNPQNYTQSMALMGPAGLALKAAGALIGASGIPGSDIIKKITADSCCKCTPKTYKAWENENKDHIIEGAPALTEKSCLSCVFGGTITINENQGESQE